MNCDKETGTCRLGEFPADKNQESVIEINSSKVSFYYFGDPMCSWCWGGSETFSTLEKICLEFDFEFKIVTGGLRAGGGDTWNESFISFLRSEWEHIADKTQSEFSFKLLQRASFDYDTEPACRAINAAREFLDNTQIYSFFKSVQKKFYVIGDDPKEIFFYKSICEEYSIPFNEFSRAFEDKKNRTETVKQFMLCRQWGVRSFPTVCFEYKGALHPFINGYLSPDKVRQRVQDNVLTLLNRG